jgi:hypothetical protein
MAKKHQDIEVEIERFRQHLTPEYRVMWEAIWGAAPGAIASVRTTVTLPPAMTTTSSATISMVYLPARE